MGGNERKNEHFFIKDSLEPILWRAVPFKHYIHFMFPDMLCC